MARDHSLVFAREAYASLLSTSIVGPHMVVANRGELIAGIARRPAVVYVDVELLPQVHGETASVPVVALIDDGLDAIVRALDEFPWVSHVMSAAMLSSPMAPAHIASLGERLRDGPEYRVLGAEGIGRVALLTHSVRRESRFERMREFFASHSVSSRGVTTLTDIAEELVTNALYDAPTESGFFKRSVPRTEDIELPPEHACEISYGVETGSAFVRVRDPFGGLSRRRMLGVLNRCNASEVSLDETRGGAGLGLWRVMSHASTVSITVIPGRLTDIVVWLDTRRSRKKQLLAADLYFQPDHELDGAQSWFAADHDSDLIDESFTAVIS